MGYQIYYEENGAAHSVGYGSEAADRTFTDRVPEACTLSDVNADGSMRASVAESSIGKGGCRPASGKLSGGLLTRYPHNNVTTADVSTSGQYPEIRNA